MRTNKLILKYIDLANLKGEILDKIQHFSKEEINLKPTENKWNISQVINHLIDSESGVNKYINHSLSKIESQPNTRFKSYISSLVLNKKLKSNEKFKAPSVLLEPKSEDSFEELKEKWDSSRLHLINMVDSFPIENMNKTIFKHPVAGPLNINQTLSFLYNHLKHHITQIEELKLFIDQSNKPKH